MNPWERVIGEWIIPIAALVAVFAVEFRDELLITARLLKRLIQRILE